jgi:hypothetical protein
VKAWLRLYEGYFHCNRNHVERNAHEDVRTKYGQIWVFDLPLDGVAGLEGIDHAVGGVLVARNGSGKLGVFHGIFSFRQGLRSWGYLG